MTVDAEKQRNHYFDLLKYLLFILVVLIHNPLPGNIGGALTAIARSAVPAYIAISGYFSKRVGKKYLKKGLNFLRIFFVMNLIWFVIYTLISYSPYRELAMWAKLAVNPKNVGMFIVWKFFWKRVSVVSSCYWNCLYCSVFCKPNSIE